MVLPDLRHYIGHLTAPILIALLGRDVFSVSDLDYIAEAVGVRPNARAWSTMIINALRESDD
ncbi:hypothetical protein, partial [Clostridium perfringens]